MQYSRGSPPHNMSVAEPSSSPFRRRLRQLRHDQAAGGGRLGRGRRMAEEASATIDSAIARACSSWPTRRPRASGRAAPPSRRDAALSILPQSKRRSTGSTVRRRSTRSWSKSRMITGLPSTCCSIVSRKERVRAAAASFRPALDHRCNCSARAGTSCPASLRRHGDGARRGDRIRIDEDVAEAARCRA